MDSALYLPNIPRVYFDKFAERFPAAWMICPPYADIPATRAIASMVTASATKGAASGAPNA